MNDPNGRLCTMGMTITGSYVEMIPPPPHDDGTPYTGCWGLGTWTFTVQTGDTSCTNKPTPLPEYQFKGDQVDVEGELFPRWTFMTDPSIRNRVKVSQGGDGLCEGELDLFSADGKEVWILKPELYSDNTLRGDGEYALYGSDQWYGDL
jgi:hypothetical protein